MKRILCAGLLLALQSMLVAGAYEADIHYSTTYVLARAVGWSPADALTIASANQGVDENEDTVAALEVDSAPGNAHAGYAAGSLHQADKNLRFHCFGGTRETAGRMSADVLRVLSGLFAEVPQHDEGPRHRAGRLIALGTALHCQQDAHAHIGFGGTCGSYAGSCYGHTYQTFFDQLIFGLLRKHYYNPDHPGVSGQQLLAALNGTARELLVRRPAASGRAIPPQELAALSQRLRASGLELPDALRRECNRYIAGQWLFGFFQSSRARWSSRDSMEKLGPAIATACRNPSLASALVISIPPPRFPRLNSDASPYLVEADGSYQLLNEGGSNDSASGVRVANVAALSPEHHTAKAKLQLSHWRQLLALPVTVQVALLADGRHLDAP